MHQATPAELCDVSGFRLAPGFPGRSVTWGERGQSPGFLPVPDNWPGLRLRPGGMSLVFRPEGACGVSPLTWTAG